ncbi:hypothetical protein GCWU000342_00085 [Shuttleworthella satelles DSM 14600]|uniref:Uncharacterized protein n=1 Tax=Shuttleworthella satelles DSM 14600 TaxID=626523 RepID=C4G8B8_9FIRM|nr:hypothetical protein GCWU000342_00085 [Shuttleworthia satelles DSM 14600]
MWQRFWGNDFLRSIRREEIAFAERTGKTEGKQAARGETAGESAVFGKKGLC